MNRQANYIIYAFLLLAAITALYLFINKVFVSSSSTLQTEQHTGSDQPRDTLAKNIAEGKALFTNHCASCHNIFKDMTGPGLLGFEERGPWVKRENVYAWIQNPALFISTNEYTRDLRSKYGSMMLAFPSLSHEMIDAICAYIKYAEQTKSNMPVAKNQRN